MQALDLTGQRFGRLTALSCQSTLRGRVWSCRCECGQICDVLTANLRSGDTRSCGCLQQSVRKMCGLTHGQSRTPLYAVWNDMLQRCTNPKHRRYADYGGRGITVCLRWQRFENFFSDMAPRLSDRHTLERKKNHLGYGPDNCVWATYQEQARNTRRNRNLTHNGKTQCMSAWAAELNLSPETLLKRLKRGWSIERALA